MSSTGKSTAVKPKIKNASVVIVRTEWNSAIVDELFTGCRKILESSKIDCRDIVVPGAFEIPFAIKKYWDNTKKQKPSAFIALGCIIRGDTPHFEYICRAVTDGIATLNLALPVPTIFGVLTVDHLEQARERIGGIHGHKGEEAAEAAMKMISLSRSLQR
jgi:6,7-dimethyl-8-ribityllumazine synthase